MPERSEAIRRLAYRLYTLCERKGWAEDAGAYNELIGAWPAIVVASLEVGHKGEQFNLTPLYLLNPFRLLTGKPARPAPPWYYPATRLSIRGLIIALWL